MPLESISVQATSRTWERPTPLMYVRDYSHPEQLEAAYVASKVEITPSGRVPMATRVVRLQLDRLWVVGVDERAPRIKWAAQSPDRTFLRFLARPGADFIIDGTVLQPGEIAHLGRGHTYYDRTDGPVHWAGISLPAEELAAAGAVITGRELMMPREPAHLAPSPRSMARLRRLHVDGLELVEATPRAELTAEGARNLEQSVIAAIVECLREPDVREPTWSRQHHATIMRRFHRVLEASPDRPLYLLEICAAIGVPERTLRLSCQEHLGMSPKHYLLLRRLHLARRALRNAEGSKTTVAEIATSLGFWHFGRFAGSYRTYFGEPPSVTLARPLD